MGAAFIISRWGMDDEKRRRKGKDEGVPECAMKSGRPTSASDQAVSRGGVGVDLWSVVSFGPRAVQPQAFLLSHFLRALELISTPKFANKVRVIRHFTPVANLRSQLRQLS